MKKKPRAGPPQVGRKLTTTKTDHRNGRVVRRLMKKSAPIDADLSKNLLNKPPNDGSSYPWIRMSTDILKFIGALAFCIKNLGINEFIDLPKLSLFVLLTQMTVGKLTEIIQLFRSALTSLF